MVRKVFGFLYKETPALHGAAYLLGFFALLSQVLAFLRDRLLAHLFGAGPTLDIYYAAFRIPDFIFVTVASIVSLSVLVPFIVEREKESRESVREFVDNIFTFFSVLIFITAGLAYLLMPTLTGILFKGFSGESLQEVVFISRILLISPIALGFSNLLGSLTQAYNRFAVYALAPLLYNLGIIFGIIVLGQRFGAEGVAFGVVLGACMHVLIQVPFAIQTGIFPRIRSNFKFSLIKKVIKLSIPRTLTLSTSYIALFFLVAMASRMPEGSISVFSLSLNIQSVPLAIIGVSYSLAAFPTLTRHYVDKNLKAYLNQMINTTRHIVFWALPMTALFIVLRAQIVRVLLGTGEFSWSDTRLTAASLALFVISSVFQCLMLLYMRAFYSAGKTKKPFFISLVSTVLLIVASYFLVEIFYKFEGFRYFMGALLRVEDLPGTVVLMLPLGYSIGTFVSCIAHWLAFEKEFSGYTSGVLRAFFHTASVSIIMGAVSYVGLLFFERFFDTSSLVGIFLQGLLAGLLGISVGVVLLSLLKSKELEEVWKAVHAKFWKVKIIATDPEIV
jgi:putative peptidoglycan lipid II flippase